MMPVNPQIRYFNGRRGYISCLVTPKDWRSHFRAVDFVTKPGAPVATKATFVLESGSGIAQKA